MNKERKKYSNKRGFTILELLIVISIIGFLASISIMAIQASKRKAYTAASLDNIADVKLAVIMYYYDHGKYPDDVSRAVPPGLEKYLRGGVWPGPSWTNSVFDWDAWPTPASEIAAGAKPMIYQITVRFCDIHGNNCLFPKDKWAENFDRYSGVYYCFEGPCRAHISKPIDHPGWCINCPESG